MGRGFLVFVLLLAIPIAFGEQIYSGTETYEIVAGTNQRIVLLPQASSGEYQRVTLEYDMEITAWRDADLPGNGNNGNWQYMIGALRKEDDGSLIGVGIRAKRNGADTRLYIDSRGLDNLEVVSLTTGTYHIKKIVDGNTKEATVEISQGGSVVKTLTLSIPSLQQEDLSSGFVATVGGEVDASNYYVQPLGWRFSNFVLNGDPGTFQTQNNSPTGSAAPVVFNDLSTPFIPTPEQPTWGNSFTVPEGTYNKLVFTVDIKNGGWWPDPNIRLHNLLWFGRGGHYLLYGYSNILKRNKLHLVQGYGMIHGLKPKEEIPFSFPPGETYRYQYTYDVILNSIELLVIDLQGNEKARMTSVPAISFEDDGAHPGTVKEPPLTFLGGGPRKIEVGFSFHDPTLPPPPSCPDGSCLNPNEVPTYGWEYKNLQIELFPGEGAGSCAGEPASGVSSLSELSTEWTVPETGGRGDIIFNVPGVDGHFSRATVDFDFFLNEFNAASPFQAIMDFRNVDTGWDPTPNPGCFFGVLALPGETIFNLCEHAEPNHWLKKSTNWQPQTWYHINVQFDAGAETAALTITDDAGNAVVQISGVPGTSIYKAGRGPGVFLGGEYTPDGVFRLAGSKYKNLEATFEPGEPVCTWLGGVGGAGNIQGTLRDAAGFVPDEVGDGEPVELASVSGQFWEQPWDEAAGRGARCPEHNLACHGVAEYWLELPSDGTAYEKVIVEFDFTTHDLLREGYFQHLVQLENACSGQRFYRFLLKHPGHGNSGMTVLNARGVSDWLKGDLDYQENTQYRAEIVMDFRDQEVHTTIYSADGNLLHTIGDKINNDPSNIGKVDHTLDGMNLVFGIYRGFPNRIYGQPHLWTFSNLEVSGVPVGGGSGGASGPGGADLSVDDGKLSFLAANMIAVADGDFTLDCGPVGEVLGVPPSVPPSSGGSYYCVMDDGDITFGTFGDVESDVLLSFVDPFYAKQITASDVDETACEGVSNLLEFGECPDAIRNKHTYSFFHTTPGSGGTAFVVVSEREIDAFDTSILEAIVEFFQGLFGVDPGTNLAGLGSVPLARFHHGYFAKQSGREVTATWRDNAFFFYSGFVTDFNDSRPDDSSYLLGSGKQVVGLELVPDRPDNVLMWRRLTSALRLSNENGTVIEGDVCGNGVKGFDEECDSSGVVGSCEELFDGLFSSGEVSCIPAGEPGECTFDISSCFGAQSGECWDDWVQPPSPNFCAEPGADPACPVPDDGGGGHEPPGPVPGTNSSVATVMAEINAPWPGGPSPRATCLSGFIEIVYNPVSNIVFCKRMQDIIYEDGDQTVNAVDVIRSSSCTGEWTDLVYIPTAGIRLCKKLTTLNYASGSASQRIVTDVQASVRPDNSCPAGWDQFSWDGPSGIGSCYQYTTIQYTEGTAASCTAENEACTQTSECCSGSVCDPQLNTCKSSTLECTLPGQPCQMTDECCGAEEGIGFCSGNTCRIDIGDPGPLIPDVP